MKGVITAAVLAGLSQVLAGMPLGAQTIELSSRTFWIGERPPSADEDFPFVALRDIDWIEAVLGKDPALMRAVVQIEEEGMSPEDSVSASVSRPHSSEVPLSPDRIPAQFNLPDYRIFGSPVPTSKSFTYLPVDPAAGYIVRCTQRDDVEHMSGCTVFASYAPDDHIRLKARLYFPPDPADRPDYFRDVVDRLREVARCLDVTESGAQVQKTPPDLLTCQSGKTS